jgi:hypothetical protein
MKRFENAAKISLGTAVRWLGGTTLLFLVVSQAAPKEPATTSIAFNRDIRPILAENCFPCHGPDSAARKAGLRLDQREEAVKSEAIIPGDPQKSHMIERIFSDDPEVHMPPARTNKKLKPEQKELLKKWIAGGAEYQLHWSLIPPKRPQPPAVKNEAWIRNPIDRFILANLERLGLAPAAEADRRTLARRLSLDLRGLPPTPEEVEAFVNDQSSDAYERFVDKLLDTPDWGEHRARYWLDAARFADTHGIHFDNYREMWTYREWVIKAFNRNLPFDQFTIEQLAGDLLPNKTLDQIIASGFNRCNITSNEGGLIPEEYLVLYTRDRTETTARVFLGLTANCAVCHDHKFDPLSQKEFYSMAAFFNNTTQGAMDGNIKDTPPIIIVPKPEDQSRWTAIGKELTETRERLEARKQAAKPEFDRWLADAHASRIYSELPHDGLKLHALLSEGAGNATTVAIDGQQRLLQFEKPLAWTGGHVAATSFKARADSIIAIDDAGDFEKEQAFSCGAWVRPAANNVTGAIAARMDEPNAFRGWDLWLEAGKPGTHIVHKFPEDSLKSIAQTPLKANEWHHVMVTYDGSGKAAGVKVYIDGDVQKTNVQFDQLKSTIKTPVPLKIGSRHTGQRLENVAIQDVRLYTRALAAEEVNRIAKMTRVAYLVGKPPANRTDAEKNDILSWWLPAMDKDYQALASTRDSLQKEEAAIKSRGTIAHVMQERPQEAMAFLLYRGEYDKRRDQVKPATPHVLPPMPEQYPHDRLGFAEWLLLPEQPLTARVTVNRFWQEVFGTGIVRTAADFGVAGELPSHPELLDWLAVEFRETGWDVKRFFKMLVTSSTYRQAAVTTAEKLEKDPFNRLLSRGPRFRMDAEMIRDYALAASGLMVHKIGGPSVKPYQPDGVWEAVAMIGSNTRDYRRDSGDNLYRRSMYTFWKRAAPPASMDIFNAPSREVCAVQRERTDTPLQALVTLNDPQFVEAARHLAERALKEGGEKVEDQINFIAQRLLARSMRSEELAVAKRSLDELQVFYKEHAEDAKKLIGVGESKADAGMDTPNLAAWTMLTNELMNLDEVLNK